MEGFMNANKLARFFHPNSYLWLYFPKKLITFLLINRCLENIKTNYEAASLIFIMKPQAS